MAVLHSNKKNPKSYSNRQPRRKITVPGTRRWARGIFSATFMRNIPLINYGSSPLLLKLTRRIEPAYAGGSNTGFSLLRYRRFGRFFSPRFLFYFNPTGSVSGVSDFRYFGSPSPNPAHRPSVQSIWYGHLLHRPTNRPKYYFLVRCSRHNAFATLLGFFARERPIIITASTSGAASLRSYFTDMLYSDSTDTTRFYPRYSEGQIDTAVFSEWFFGDSPGIVHDYLKERQANRIKVRIVKKKSKKKTIFVSESEKALVSQLADSSFLRTYFKHKARDRASSVMCSDFGFFFFDRLFRRKPCVPLTFFFRTLKHISKVRSFFSGFRRRLRSQLYRKELPRSFSPYHYGFHGKFYDFMRLEPKGLNIPPYSMARLTPPSLFLGNAASSISLFRRPGFLPTRIPRLAANFYGFGVYGTTVHRRSSMAHWGSFFKRSPAPHGLRDRPVATFSLVLRPFVPRSKPLRSPKARRV